MLSPPSYDSLLSKAHSLCYTNIHGGSESGWIFHSRQKDVEIATKTVGENVWSKGTGIIPFPVEIVHYIFADREYRPKWDAMFDCGADVEKIDKDTVISYAAFKAPWPVASRDFVIIGRTTPVPPPEGPGLFIHTISIEDRRAPVKKPYVRGTIMFSGVYITACKDNPQHSNVTYVVASDPNGSLPKWLVNAAAVSQPLCIAMIRAFLQSNPAVVANVQKIIAARNAAPAQTNGDIGEPTPAATTIPPSTTDVIVFTPTPYDAVLERAKADSLDAIRADGEVSGWTFHSRQQEVDIYLKRVPGSTTEQCKGIGEIAAPADVVTALFNGDGEVRLKWDEMFEKGHVVKEYDAYTGLYYSAFKAPWPVAPRDFFIVYRNQHLPDGSLLTWSTSLTDNQLCPHAKGYVRGTLFYSGLLVTPITPNSCRVVYCLGSDPNGNIPKMIVNAANVKQPLCIAVIRDLLKKEPSLIAKVRAEEAAKLQAFQNKQQQTIEQKVNGTTSSSTSTTSATTTTTATTSEKPIFAVTKYDPVLIKARADTWAGLQGGTDDGWIFHSRQKEVDIFTKTVGGNVYTKGVGTVPFPPHVCSYIFTDKTTRTHWDEMFEKGHDVERLDGYTNIAYTAFKAPWPVSSRDFVIVGRAEQLDDGSIFVFSCSCTHPREPVKKNYVRGTIHYSGMLFTPIAGTTHTRVTYLVASDPNGSLPKSLVNAAAVSQPLCIARVREFLLKDPQLVASIPPFGSKLTTTTTETATNETSIMEEDANDVETIVPLDPEMANNELYTRFMSISHWSHFRTCISTLSRLPLAFLCPSAWSSPVTTTTKAAASSDVQVGVLSVRVIKVKPDVDRKWPNKIKENSYHCRVTHAGQTYDTTTGTEWSQDCAFPVYNPDGELHIVLMGEHTDSHKQMMLGSCSLPLMECAAPAPGMARRGWYRLETREGPAQLVLCIETSYAFSMLSDLSSEFRPRPPSPAPADAIIVAQYDAATLVDHAWSVVDAIEPVYAIAKQQVDVWKWTNVTTSVLILMAFIGLCFYPEWLPAGIIIYLLTLLLLSCARIHFRIAAVGGDTWWKQQTLRNTRRRILIDAIRRRETQMTVQTKRQLQWLQHQFGRLAQQIESTFSVLTWRSPESSTATVAYLVVCLILSITLSFQYLSVFVAVTLFSSRSKQAGSVAWVLNRGLNHIRRRHAYHQAIRMRG